MTHDDTPVPTVDDDRLVAVQIERTALRRLKAALARHPDAAAQHEAISAAVHQLAEGLELLQPQESLWERARAAQGSGSLSKASKS